MKDYFNSKIFKKKDNLVSRKIGNEYLIVPIINNVAEMNRMFTLNEVGSFIWDQIDGHKCVEDIISSVHAEFDIDKQTAQQDVSEFLKNTEKVLFI